MFNKNITPFLPNKKSKRQLIDIQSMTFQLISHELDQFIEKVKSNGSILLLVTTPINYNIAPQRACSASISPEIQEQINSAEDYISRGLLKQGLLALNNDKLKNIPNPYLYYLRGKVHQNLLEYTKSMEMYRLAASFDCKLWRTTPILNNILKNSATKHRALLFDFAKMTSDDFFVNETFIDELYPQDVYYERLTKSLGSELKKILKL